MPAIPSSLLEPVWVEFAALLPVRPDFDPGHPLGCHRRQIADRVVFEHVVDALVHGSGYERIATVGCSDRTIRRRLETWAQMGLGQRIHALALDAYDRMIGLDLADLYPWTGRSPRRHAAARRPDPRQWTGARAA